MSDAKKPHQHPFFVRQANLPTYHETEKGAIKGYNSEADAVVDRDDRNTRAKRMGLKARYEVIAS